MYRELRNGQLSCRVCKKWFPVEHFQHHTQKDGKTRPGSYCKECKKARGRVDMAKLRYGLTKEQFAELEAKYPVCVICGSSQVFIDHNHTTGKIRGRLCRHCNTGLGMFREDVNLLEAAKKYLTSFSNPATIEL